MELQSHTINVLLCVYLNWPAGDNFYGELLLAICVVFLHVHHTANIFRTVDKLLFQQIVHNRFTALLEYVRDHPDEQVTER